MHLDGRGRGKLLLVYYAVPNEDVITRQKLVNVPQGVCDIGSGFLVFEQIGEHGGGFLWTVSFTEFGQASEGCPVGGVLFDPRGGLIPSARGAQRSGVSAVDVDFVTHAVVDCTTRMDTEQWLLSAALFRLELFA